MNLKCFIVLPVFIFGPYAVTYPRPITKETLGTNGMIHGMIHGPSPWPPINIVDVRDVAKSHVLALGLPRNPGALERRYLVSAGNLVWREAIDHLKITHPELKTPSSEYPDVAGPLTIVDTSNTIADLKFGKFIDTKQIIEDAVVALQEVEKTWTN